MSLTKAKKAILGKNLYEEYQNNKSKANTTNGRTKKYNITSYQKKKKEEENPYLKIIENSNIAVGNRDKEAWTNEEKQDLSNRQNIYAQYLKKDSPDFLKEKADNPTAEDIRNIQQYYNKSQSKENTLNEIRSGAKTEIEGNKYSNLSNEELNNLLEEKEAQAGVLSYQLNRLNDPSSSNDKVLNSQYNKDEMQSELNALNDDINTLKSNKDKKWYQQQEQVLSQTPDDVLELLIERNRNKLKIGAASKIDKQLNELGYDDEQIKELDTYIDYALDKQEAILSENAEKQYADMSPVSASVQSIPKSLLGGLGLIEEARADVTDTPLNVYAESERLGREAEVARETVGSNINSDVGRFMYNVGMSGADSLASAFIPNGAFLLGASTATSTTRDLIEKGAPTDQAIIGGAVSGVFETLFEEISIGNFDKLKEVSPNSLKDIAKNTLKTIGVNTTEEANTEIANIAYDTLANGDFSDAEILKKQYIQAGMTEAEAEAQVKKDLFNRVLEAGLSGAVMGGGFGVIGSAIGYEKGKYNTDTSIDTENTNTTNEDTAIMQNQDEYAGTSQRVNEEIAGKSTAEQRQILVNNIESIKAEGQNALQRADEALGKISPQENIDTADSVEEENINTKNPYSKGTIKQNFTEADGTKVVKRIDYSDNIVYDEKMAKNVQAEYEASTDEDLVKYYERVINGEKTKPYYPISEVNEQQVKDIKELTGVDLTDYTNALNKNISKHIEKNHGKYGISDQSMSDSNDVGRIEYVLNNYDDIELLEDKSDAFINQDNSKASLIRFSKRINGTHYIVEAVNDGAKKILWINSIYKTKNASRLPDVQASGVTSETSPLNSVSVNSTILQKAKNVNNTKASQNILNSNENFDIINTVETKGNEYGTRTNDNQENLGNDGRGSDRGFGTNNDENTRLHIRGSQEGSKNSSRYGAIESNDAYNIVKNAKEASDRGAYVTLYEEADYKNFKNYTTEDGLNNVSIKENGDIVSVIKNPKSKINRVAKTLLKTAIDNGGDRLDCYGKGLVDIYAKYGFEPVAKVKFVDEYAPDNWNYERDGRPDIYVMKLNKDGQAREYNDDYLDKLPYMDYDEALNYRDNIIEQEAENDTSLKQNSKDEAGDTPAFLNETLPKINQQALLDKTDKTSNSQHYTGKTAEEMTSVDNNKRKKETLTEKVSKAGAYIMRKFADSGAAIYKIANKAKDMRIYHSFDMQRGNSARIGYVIGEKLTSGKFEGAQTNARGEVIGKSLMEVLDPVLSKGKDYIQDFNWFIFNQHNIDRETFDKGIYGSKSNKLKSQNAVNAMLKKHPEFADISADIQTFVTNELQFRVDTGQLSIEEFNLFRSKYPNYIPTFRVQDGKTVLDMGDYLDKSQYDAKAVAKGAQLELLPFTDQLIEYTKNGRKQGYINQFFNELLDYASKNDELSSHISIVEISDFSDKSIKEVMRKHKDKDNTYTALTANGNAIVFKVDSEINEAIKSISEHTYEFENTIFAKAVNKFGNTFRSLVTDKSPMFVIRNAIRDPQEAVLNTTNAKEFIKAYPEAYEALRTKNEYYKMFMADGVMGGSFFSEIDIDKADKKSNIISKGLEGIEIANTFIEAGPRMAEYIATLKRLGRTDYSARMEATYNAKEVTTNFGRSGEITRLMNRYGFTFLNAKVQGFDKQIRNFTDKSKGERINQISTLVAKYALLGVAPQILSNLLYDEDEEYERLRERDKEQYYLIKVGDGKFIKIPKGRALSVGATLANRAMAMANGEDVDIKDALNVMWSNIGVDAPTNNVFSALIQAKRNTTWYGGSIVDGSLSGKPKKEQHDESTDKLSVYLGGIFNISPKKINYVLDQYSGVIGDFLLPVITPKYQGGSFLDYVVSPFKNSFTLDSVTNNKISSEFYEKLNNAKTKAYADNSSLGSQATYQFINSQSKEVNALWNEIHNIQIDPTLTLKERNEKVRDIRKLINGIQQNALNNVDVYEEEAEYLSDEYDDMWDVYNTTNAKVYGGEYALKARGGKTYENAVLCYGAGISYDDYFEYYMATKDLNAKDKNGNSVSGLKKKRTVEAINGLPLSKGQKTLLYAQSYTVHENSDDGKVLKQYIQSLNLTKKEKESLYYSIVK